MADGIRGKQFENFHSEIQKGVVLHRAIDTYTDAHHFFRQSTKRLHKNYHHYSGVIVDVFYDHFLAKNWKNYSDEELEVYVARFYKSLHDNHTILTDKTKSIMPYMIEQNWLVSYQNIGGIERILTQMDRRLNNDSNLRFSVNELQIYYSEFEAEFTDFFKEVQHYSKQKLLTL